jgi:CHAD domain-containing protein
MDPGAPVTAEQAGSGGQSRSPDRRHPHREREAKLTAPLEWVLPTFTGIAGVREVVELPPAELEAVYFDSRDLRLLRNGITLRHRQDAAGGSDAERGWTLKLPGKIDAAALVRSELSWPGSPEEIPAEAAALVRAVVRGDPLHPVARLVTRRRRFRLIVGGGVAGGEIDDDVVAIVQGHHPGERFREIEVEASASPPPGFLDAVVAHLEKAGASKWEQVPKLARALGEHGGLGPSIPAHKLDRHATIRDVIAASIGAAVDTLTRHDAGLRLGGDIEHVHKARVATRRLRSDLRTFSPGIDGPWLSQAEEDLLWAGAALGEVRDADVLMAGLKAQIRDLGPPDAIEAGILLSRLAAEREAANRRLIALLDSDRYLRLLSVLHQAATEPPLCTQPGRLTGDEAAALILPSMVAKAYKRLRRHVGSLPADPSDEALHETRKRAKRLRYASEAAAPVVGEVATKLAARAERLQGVLGEFHDATVGAAWVRDRGPAGTPAQALVAGELLATLRAMKASRRQGWVRSWKKLRKKRLRRWLTAAPVPDPGDCREPVAEPAPAGGGWISPAEIPSPGSGP